jgi:hypothetical protein
MSDYNERMAAVKARRPRRDFETARRCYYAAERAPISMLLGMIKGARGLLVIEAQRLIHKARNDYDAATLARYASKLGVQKK